MLAKRLIDERPLAKAAFLISEHSSSSLEWLHPVQSERVKRPFEPVSVTHEAVVVGCPVHCANGGEVQDDIGPAILPFGVHMPTGPAQIGDAKPIQELENVAFRTRNRLPAGR